MNEITNRKRLVDNFHLSRNNFGLCAILIPNQLGDLSQPFVSFPGSFEIFPSPSVRSSTNHFGIR